MKKRSCPLLTPIPDGFWMKFLEIKEIEPEISVSAWRVAHGSIAPLIIFFFPFCVAPIVALGRRADFLGEGIMVFSSLFLVFGPTTYGAWVTVKLFPHIRSISQQAWREQLYLAGFDHDAYIQAHVALPMAKRLMGCMEWGVWGLWFMTICAVCGYILPPNPEPTSFIAFTILPIAYFAYIYSAEAVARWGVAELMIQFSVPNPGRKPAEVRAGSVAALAALPAVLWLPSAVLLATDGSSPLLRVIWTLACACASLGLMGRLRRAARENWDRAMDCYYRFD